MLSLGLDPNRLHGLAAQCFLGSLPLHSPLTFYATMRLSDPPTRFDVRMPLDLAQDMQDLEENTGLSRGEIFRRAIALYKRAKMTQADKGYVILRDSKGVQREVVGI